MPLQRQAPLSRANQDFIRDPFAFISANVVNNQNLSGAVYGVPYQPDIALRGRATTVIQYADAHIRTIDLDFVPHPRQRRCFLPRPLLRALVGQNPMGLGLTLAQRTGLLNALPVDPPNVVRGYYFPYLTGPVNGVGDLGWVDILRTNPTHPFTFTGAMNGCAIVVTDSPEGPNLLRVYHYQNEESNPYFLPKRLGGGGNRFPNRVRYWLGNRDYRGRTDEEVAGFNFLHYHAADQHWWLYSLPLKQKAPNLRRPQDGIPIDRSSKRPFRARINY
jgi:hypothetical protein